ncbi:MAG: hypothetical protein OXH11_08245 [Candidatus Aminicenantes bacterium]|nr:hypothetical protein [Candidatus Aminicenantes bacterium]
MIIDTVVTHPDWAAAWGNWGRVGVRRIADACAAGGIRRIYWRANCGSRVFYPSRLEDTFRGEDREACEVPEYWKVTLAETDYSTWNLLEEAVECTLGAGLEPWVWYSPYEESHGQVSLTRFAREHPEFHAVARDGHRRSSRLSFAYPEVRRHKLAVVEELMSYGFRGVLLDFVRQLPRIDENLPPQLDLHGVCRYGYEEPALESYRRTHEVDPREQPNHSDAWIRHRAEYVTCFMEELKRQRRTTGSNYPVSVLVSPESPLSQVLPDWPRYVRDGLLEETNLWRVRTDALRGALVDWTSWLAGDLCQEAHIMLPEWNLARLDPDDVKRQIRQARHSTGGGGGILAGIYCYNMDQLGLGEGSARLEAGVRAAREAGARAVVLWESTSIESWSGWDKYLPSGLWATVAKLAAEA